MATRRIRGGVGRQWPATALALALAGPRLRLQCHSSLPLTVMCPKVWRMPLSHGIPGLAGEPGREEKELLQW